MPVQVKFNSSNSDIHVLLEANEADVNGAHSTTESFLDLLLVNNNKTNTSRANVSVAYNIPVYLQWSSWSQCSSSCGPGLEIRRRSPVEPAIVALNQTRPCTSVSCPPQCQFTPWSSWSPCSATCSAFGMPPPRSVRSRTTLINHVSCDAQIHAFRYCNVSDCPQDCVHSPMQAVPCNKKCGGGEMHYIYYVQLENTTGGIPCPKNLTTSCNTHVCEDVVHTDTSYASRGTWVVGVALVLMVGHSIASVNRP